MACYDPNNEMSRKIMKNDILFEKEENLHIYYQAIKDLLTEHWDLTSSQIAAK